jgi:hypothetical protein
MLFGISGSSIHNFQHPTEEPLPRLPIAFKILAIKDR